MNPLGDFPNKLPIGDALDLGWKVSVMGVAIVFLALVCLIILTIVYPKVFGWILPRSRARLDRRAERRAERKLARANSKAAVKLSDEAVAAETKVAPVVSEDTQRSTDDQELVAVISAAVAASLGTSSNGIRIRSIKRSGSNTPAWGRRGRTEQFRF